MTAFLTTTQGDLFRPEDLPECDEYLARSVAMGEYTGELLFRQNPRLYKATAAMLAAGMGIRQVSRLTGLCCRSVSAVLEHEGQAIATIKQRLASTLLHLGMLGAEAVLESLQSGEPISPKERRDLMIAVGIAIDKGLLTAGEATWRGEVLHRPAPGHDDYNRMLESEGVEVTGSRGETPAQKSAAPGASEGPLGPEPAPGGDPRPAIGPERQLPAGDPVNDQEGVKTDV